MANMKILSMGAGVQTTAMLIRYKDTIDKIIFADTGAEWPHTYDYIEKYLKPFALKTGIEWLTVSGSNRYKDIEEHCKDQRVIPFRQNRWCTNDFKIGPINRKLKELGATRHKPAHVMIGFTIDEAHRMKFFPKDKPLYNHRIYPLLDDKITRRQCKEIIKNHGWPIPAKSGCDFCPFARKSQFRALLGSNPERFKEIVAMEKHGRDYPKATLKGMPLETMLHNTALTDWMDDDFETCDTGHCFT